MTGIFFFETLRRHWRGMVIWGIGLGFLAWVQMIVLPSVDALEQIAEIFETLPPFLLQAFGGGDVEFLGTPEGYLASQFFSIALLTMAIYAVVVGLNVTSADEERGILDSVLSLPIPRWRLIVERTLAYSVSTLGVVALTYGGLWLGVQMTPALASLDMERVLMATINIVPGALFALGVTVLIGAAIRRRSTALAIAVGFVIASYFLDTLALAATGTALADARGLSFFRYYDGVEVMRTGLIALNMIILGAGAVIALMLALVAFTRRDVGA